MFITFVFLFILSIVSTIFMLFFGNGLLTILSLVISVFLFVMINESYKERKLKVISIYSQNPYDKYRNNNNGTKKSKKQNKEEYKQAKKDNGLDEGCEISCGD